MKRKQKVYHFFQESVDVYLTVADIPLLNKKMVGYYRVTYDEAIWRDIGRVLATNHHHVHPYNRAQIICDLAHLAAHGYVSQDLADQVMAYYHQNEEDWVVVVAYYECVIGEEQGGGRARK